MTKFLAIAAFLLSLAPYAARAGAQADLVAKGEYVTRAADCEACHTMPGGQPFAGGRAFVLPFGVLYSPNITPGQDTNIGSYSDDDWVRMLRRGVGLGGKHLYPAMPYPSYTRMSRDDALAIKAYLLTLAPVNSPVPANAIGFPFNQRWGMFFWNLLNNPDQRFQPDPAQSAAYNRGGYLVQSLGHCGECHTPRNLTFGLESSQALAGAMEDGWMAYNLTSDPSHGLGNWSDSDLASYLATGQAPGHGPASGPMAEAVSDSLRYLSPDDIHAIVTYLRAIPAQPDGPPITPSGKAPLASSALASNTLGAHLFAEACAGCHLTNGAGRQSAWAALGGSHSASDPAGVNIVQILSQGTNIETSQGVMFMHPFTGGYTDYELAALANYAISQFGHRQGNVTPTEIHAQRKPSSDSQAKPES